MSLSMFRLEAPNTHCLSTSLPRTSVPTQPKAPTGENPPGTVTMVESGHQRAPQSSAACPLQGQGLATWALEQSGVFISSLERLAFFPQNLQTSACVCVCVCVAVAFIHKFITAFTKLRQNHSPVCCLTHSTTRDLNPEIMYQ